MPCIVSYEHLHACNLTVTINFSLYSSRCLCAGVRVLLSSTTRVCSYRSCAVNYESEWNRTELRDAGEECGCGAVEAVGVSTVIHSPDIRCRYSELLDHHPLATKSATSGACEAANNARIPPLLLLWCAIHT
jgi:hypothetical protein